MYMYAYKNNNNNNNNITIITYIAYIYNIGSGVLRLGFIGFRVLGHPCGNCSSFGLFYNVPCLNLRVEGFGFQGEEFW